MKENQRAKKIKLTELKLQSFVTQAEQGSALKGGVWTNEKKACSWDCTWGCFTVYC